MADDRSVMMAGAEVARRTLDLTRAPREQWNDEMFELVAKMVLRRAGTLSEQVYCLAVADSLALNPLIDEIHFLPVKSTDGSGAGLKPYIGRNGLVKKAAERGYYFEADTVREHDKFRMTRQRDGSRTVTHSYGHARDRGEIVGAYAFLHRLGGELPAFAYAPLDEYLPTFDAEWKMDKSPWGNQRSAMIQKCAMIMAGRERLDLGNVLIDGEIAIFEQMQAAGPGGAPSPVVPPEFDFDELTADHELAQRLRVAAPAAGWAPAKCEMVMRGMDEDALRALADRLEAEAEAIRGVSHATESATATAGDPVRDGASDGDGGSGGLTGAPGPVRATDRSGDELQRLASEMAASAVPVETEVIADAVVVPDAEHVAALRKRVESLEERLNDPFDELGEDALRDLAEELERVRGELAAAEDPGQGRLI